MKKVLVSCPPMLGLLNEFIPIAIEKKLNLIAVDIKQSLSEEELIKILPKFDGWIIGDDPATRNVFNAGVSGNLKAAVKWGIGVDNVDFEACKEFNIPITNTPHMFGAEVADVALAYIIGLSRHLFSIDRDIRFKQLWPKPSGISLSGKKIAVVGLGDIGRNLTKRLLACDMKIIGYDPFAGTTEDIERDIWPNRIEEVDFIVFTCSLNKSNFHILNKSILEICKDGVYIINVSRGQLIDETSLYSSLLEGKISGVALDVFEEEPLSANSKFRSFDNLIFGSHNASNSKDAVRRASLIAIEKIHQFLFNK
jgi:D-3-phosphoglycerate dehydrogenase